MWQILQYLLYAVGGDSPVAQGAIRALNSGTQDAVPGRILIIILSLVAFVVATTVHEFGHAFMADKLGDPTPRAQKRVTLSPFAHLDPLGTLLLVVTSFIGFPIGWGRPVRTNPDNFSCGAKIGMGLVAVAGPLMNLATAIALAPIARFLLFGGIGDGSFAIMSLLGVCLIMLVNLSLFCFNLVPVAPLDGSHILASLLPESLSLPFRTFMAKFGPAVLVVLMFTGKLGDLLSPLVFRIFFFLIGIERP